MGARDPPTETDDAIVPEPYRVKVVEPIRVIPREERIRKVREAGFNLFRLRAEDVYVDLLTDSGVGAMSAHQWAGLMEGDESYAGSRNFYHLRDAVEEILGFPFTLPTHQGRGAENVLDAAILKPGQTVLGNTPFDTTRAHIEHRHGRVVDCTVDEGHDPANLAPFKGNVDLRKLEGALQQNRGNVAYVLVTATCNSAGGQPVSLENLRAVAAAARREGVLFLLDIARFAENAHFIQEREPGQASRTVREISRDMCALADGALMSGKKNALVNIGGFIATRKQDLYDRCVPFGILFEGFSTYGGLAGRDLEGMARGLREAVEEPFLAHRVGQVRYLHQRLGKEGVPLLCPPGGHAVYIDALAFLPHLPRERFPGHTLGIELYVEGGVRGVEIGAVMEGRDPESGENRWPRNEYLRLAIPARTYTRDHLDHVARSVLAVWRRRHGIQGYAFDQESPVLRHFASTFRPWGRGPLNGESARAAPPGQVAAVPGNAPAPIRSRKAPHP